MAAVGGAGQWREEQRRLWRLSGREVREALRCREEAAWLCEDTKQHTNSAQEDVRYRIKEKLTTTSRWKQELQEELAMNTKQTESLKKNLSKLRKALIKSDEPLKVNSECQQYRKSRIGIDNIQDDVEDQLTKEVDCIRDYQQRMKLLVELIIKQFEANKLAQKKLNTDIRNKV